jgi:hypothetical protein
MKTLKMSLENIQGKMSRMEMKNIMAGEVKLADNGGGGSSNPGTIVCAASSTYMGPLLCFTDAASASSFGSNGWWCCNCGEALRRCTDLP